MRKALLVARWEFLTTVTRRAYIFAVIAMPLFYGGMFALAGFVGRSATASTSRVPTAIVDRAGIVDLEFAAAQASRRDNHRPSDAAGALMDRSADSMAAAAAALMPPGGLVAYDDLEHALDALRAQRVGAVFVVEADYLRTGALSVYARDSNLFSQQTDQRRQAQVADALRASLLETSVSGDALARAYAPAAAVKRLQINAQGRVEEAAAANGLGPFAGSFGVILLLTMSIFFSAGFLQQATIADRQNRMIEILLSSVDADELLIGKILGLGGAALLQVAIYVALIIVPGTAIFALFHVPAGTVALALVYFVIGYALFASLMAGTGMLGRTAQESAQLSALWTISAASPWFFIPSIGTAPNGVVARALSFFPLTSPITMMLRLGTGDVPTTDLVISMLVDMVAIYIALRGASRIFRAASLMHGKRATLPEFLRWLRAA